jgi:hypothetical protein
MSFQPQRRSYHRSSYWILVADRTGSTLEKYHLVQLDGSSITENTVESSKNEKCFVGNKSLYCSFCAENFLDYIGKMATKYSYS